jgi:hypothetical protein
MGQRVKKLECLKQMGPKSMENVLKLIKVLVSYCCCNKLPWIKITRVEGGCGSLCLL